MKAGKASLAGLSALALLYALLLIPAPKSPVLKGANQHTFEWKQDLFWGELEKEFVRARNTGCADLTNEIQQRSGTVEQGLIQLATEDLPVDHLALRTIETNVFRLAPLIGACPKQLNDYAALVSRLRFQIKRQAQHWNLESLPVRETLYRLLTGSRMALEEAALQAPAEHFSDIVLGETNVSAAPVVEFKGIKLCSGDILVSRGGAPTSALIARGNDYPGSFSHVALLHVDEKTGQASMVESHIECGVAVASLTQYLEDKKLRIMALRLRSDLPAIRTDPLLAHRVATAALLEARTGHIPYDFTMDFRDHKARFCSEVVSAAYEPAGINLWMGVSYISSDTVTAWLGSLGARHFTTQEPADLEYDPQLVVVAEWRESNALFKAHVDDAVTDVMLEAAAAGQPLAYNAWLLPLSRLAKAWSALLNLFGKIGPVPEGMSATSALRVKKYRLEHETIAARVMELASRFRAEKGYTPPYWELLALARRVDSESAPKL